MPRPYRLSVVVPVRNSLATLPQSLSAILASDIERDSYELIVVDESSTDGSVEFAGRFADTVIRLSGSHGVAYARNRGAELARGEILAFIDADAVIARDTLSQMLETMADDSSAVAVCASRADVRGAANLASQYLSAVWRLGEERGPGKTGDIGGACTVIRRDAFLSAGMFDEWRFGNAPVEGIELGRRLDACGFSVLHDRQAEVTVLKPSPLGRLCREIFSRSVTLTRGIGYRPARLAVPDDIVFTLSNSILPVFAVLFLVMISTAFLPKAHLAADITVVVITAIIFCLRDYRYFARTRGVLFAIAVAPVHLLMQMSCAIGVCIGRVLRDVFGDMGPDATTQAYAEVGVETWPPVPRALGQ